MWVFSILSLWGLTHIRAKWLPASQRSGCSYSVSECHPGHLLTLPWYMRIGFVPAHQLAPVKAKMGWLEWGNALICRSWGGNCSFVHRRGFSLVNIADSWRGFNGKMCHFEHFYRWKDDLSYNYFDKTASMRNEAPLMQSSLKLTGACEEEMRLIVGVGRFN